MNYYYLLIPFIGAVIGYFTNYIAVKMLFRPLKPINIPILKMKIQGLLPSRREELAVSIAESIEQNLLSLDSIIRELDQDLIRDELNLVIEETVQKRINKNFKYILPQLVKDISSEIIVEIITEEIDSNFEDWIETIIDKMKDQVKIKEIVKDKIKSFSFIKLESIVLEIAGKELKHIEVLGGFIGFIIGIVQLVIVYYL
ncbi:MAG: DUF445 family protein [Halanaerobiales bacterium]|nr:DUF445 family protein [Halanaerobiales bacterium]